MLSRADKGVHRRLRQERTGRRGSNPNNEADLNGLVLGHHLMKIEQAGRTSCMIGADNQAAVKAVLMELTHPGQYLHQQDDICWRAWRHWRHWHHWR